MGRWGIGWAGLCAVLLLAGCGTTTANTGSMTIDRSELDAFLSQHTDEITTCYANQVKRNGSLRGIVVVRFIVTPSHRAKSITLAQNTTGNDQMWRCMQAAIASWEFPFELAQDVIVEQPFSFDPGHLSTRL